MRTDRGMFGDRVGVLWLLRLAFCRIVDNLGAIS